MTSSVEPRPNDRKVILDILVEFIEVSIHCILYNRNLYPQGVFEKRNKYNVPVQMCQHPEVRSYVNSIIESLALLLSEGRVDKISVVILKEETGEPLEKFVIEVREIRDKWRDKDPNLLQTERALRSFLLKLNVSDALLKPPTTGTTWTIHVDTTEAIFEAVELQLIEKDFAWIEAEEKQASIENATLVPLRSNTSDAFRMQLYVEERKAELSETLINSSDGIIDNSCLVDDTLSNMLDTTCKPMDASSSLLSSASTSQET
ncbi:mitotic spindle assembly checkpoint protein MAD2B [Biomphalaria pfeifferi]|uniref:Mitotic spindle assembly checkpoint protein MAD2B n=1 Tax=Biomphalaria pfeifferi TaxID=112525 RepID=A0AAD8FDA9_BIOPF|nr:mitotic spindle assembly checkpoint protein MAD2B [Biomphalaria pfeifferi]